MRIYKNQKIYATFNCVKMVRMVELFIICVTLVATGNSAPWSENNDLREYDLEWQCEQLCERLYGKSIYNDHNSTCSCTIDHDDPEINWMRIKNNARNLGLILEIINSHTKNIIKRETPAERLKKLIDSKKQETVPIENETLGKENTKIDTLPVSPESERIKKLKELLQNKRQSKITTNLESDKPIEKQNDDNTKTSPVKIPISIVNKKNEAEIEKQDKIKDNNKLSLVERLKLKKINAPTKLGDQPQISRTELFLEKRRKLREQLKERLLAARNRNKTPEVILKN